MFRKTARILLRNTPPKITQGLTRWSTDLDCVQIVRVVRFWYEVGSEPFAVRLFELS